MTKPALEIVKFEPLAPDADVVACLEKLLARAKSGMLRGIVAVATETMDQGAAATSIVNVGERDSIVALGKISMLEHEMRTEFSLHLEMDE